MDAKLGTDYHKRLNTFVELAQTTNVIIGGAMTDPESDRSKPAHQQVDRELFLRVVRQDKDRIYVSGAKMHRTGVEKATHIKDGSDRIFVDFEEAYDRHPPAHVGDRLAPVQGPQHQDESGHG